jgi:glycosyltransferase involved in cell wall biosynthesis
MNFQDIRIFVSLPCYGGQLTTQTQQGWTKIMTWANARGVHLTLRQIVNESTLSRARNMSLANCMDDADYFTHILFIDADMGFDPDNLERLLLFDRDVVGCPGPVKYIHWDLAVDAMLNGRDIQYHTLRYAVNFIDPENIEFENGFAKVKDFGLCFCLVKTAAVKRMQEAYPDLKIGEMGWQDGKPFVSDNLYMFFDTLRSDEKVDDQDRHLECDHAFLARWRALGGTVWGDITSNLSHVGSHVFEGNAAHVYLGREWQDGNFKAARSKWGRYPQPEEESPQTA